MRILGISGSLRRDSHNTRLLRGVGELLPPDSALDGEIVISREGNDKPLTFNVIRDDRVRRSA